MKRLHSGISTATLLGVFIMMVGAPGLAQSQDYYGAKPYVSPYYDPLFPEDNDYEPEDEVLTDSKLRALIITDLGISPFVNRDDIYVSVKNGIATLSGDVDDRSEMIDAVEIAYDAGAWRVQNKLHRREVSDRPWAELSDRELAREIERELSLSPFVNSAYITVHVREGVATLYGGVENTGEIADAVENAYEAGAKRVKSRLWVDHELS